MMKTQYADMTSILWHHFIKTSRRKAGTFLHSSRPIIGQQTRPHPQSLHKAKINLSTKVKIFHLPAKKSPPPSSRKEDNQQPEERLTQHTQALLETKVVLKAPGCLKPMCIFGPVSPKHHPCSPALNCVSDNINSSAHSSRLQEITTG